MRLSHLPRAWWGLRRSRQILAVLAKYGFGDLLGSLRLRHPLITRLPLPGKLRQIEELSRPERLRLAFEELGPTFIKLGQLLSLRPDLIPPEYAAELAKLQDEAAPFPFTEVRRKLEEQLGRPLERLFSEFDEKPLAAASLAQVHRARTKSGEEVAVKVQRPGVRERVRADLIILEELATLIARYVPESELYDPVGAVREFSKTLRRELDFVREGRNMEVFRRNFAGDETVHIPRVFWELTSREVLTMEWIEGIKITDLEGLERAGLDRRQIALNGANLILKQVFEHGFFHADPHPGNVLVLEGNVLAPVDYGMVGRLDEPLQRQLGELLVGVVQKDIDRLIRALGELGSLDERTDLGSLRRDLTDFIDRYYRVPLAQLDVGQLLDEALTLFREHRVRLPASLVMMAKALVIEEGVGRLLYPELDMITLAKPYIQRLLLRRLAPQRELRRWALTVEEGARLARELPMELRLLLGKLRRGELRLQFEQVGFERLLLHVDRVGNRLSLALVIAALIVGSAVMMGLEVGPKLWGLSLLGLLGLALAALLGLGLALAILRSGRL